jgi:flagellar hook assembly protein FlgD
MNFEEEIDEIITDTASLSKIKNTKKLTTKVKKIKKKIIVCDDEIEQIVKTKNLAESSNEFKLEENEAELDSNLFSIYIIRIKEIQLYVENNNSIININEYLKLYDELTTLTNYCKKFMESVQLKVNLIE